MSRKRAPSRAAWGWMIAAAFVIVGVAAYLLGRAVATPPSAVPIAAPVSSTAPNPTDAAATTIAATTLPVATTSTAPVTTSIAPTTTTAAPTANAAAARPPVASLDAGLFCRDLAALGYTFAEALDYWHREGSPNRMDADRNGVPCETIYPPAEVAAGEGGAPAAAPPPAAPPAAGTTTKPTAQPDPERDALVALYRSTRGPNWQNNAGWDTGADPCTWFGITCGPRGIDTIRLSGNNLSGPIPGEISALSDLRQLDLANNQVTGPLPEELGDLSSLELLDLSGNVITGAIPDHLGDLANLETLALGSNILTGGVPASVATNLHRLHELRLENNRLSGSLPPFAGLDALEVLTLYGCQLSGPIPSGIGAHPVLIELDASHNRLNGPIPPEIASLSNLQDLYLNGNGLTGPIPAALGDLRLLEHLDLSDNGLSGDIPMSLYTGLAKSWGGSLRSMQLHGNGCFGFTLTIGDEFGWLNSMDPKYLDGCP